jgi:hypothetical protein
MIQAIALGGIIIGAIAVKIFRKHGKHKAR